MGRPLGLVGFVVVVISLAALLSLIVTDVIGLIK
jgi:hypothetical protein